MKLMRIIILMLLGMLLAGCELENATDTPPSAGNVSGTTATVTRVIDGDTIDVQINGQQERVRYVGMNTPERDEACYAEATAANRALVEGKTVTLVRDDSDRDRYDRLLRYIYVGDTFVNEVLVQQGWAEAVVYEPDDREYNHFLSLEREAANNNRGCHPTGIFNDGSDTR